MHSSLLKESKPNLSKRLQLIAQKVPEGARIADIGTDHAYIPIYLVLEDKVKYAIASDVRQGPVKIAINNIKKYKLEKQIDVRIGNGLETIKPGEVNTVIIAGMGGTLITEILSSAESVLSSIDTLILQPMTEHETVRKWLLENSYQIVDEELVLEDHKIYTVLVVKHGKEEMEKEIDLKVGKKLIEKKDPLLNHLIEHKIKEIKKIILKLKGQSSEKSRIRLEECKKQLEEYEELKKQIAGSGEKC